MERRAQDEALVTKLEAAFKPYTLPEVELTRVRRTLQHYVSSQIEAGDRNGVSRSDSQNALSQIGRLTGIRARYVEAVLANQRAKENYAAAVAELNSRTAAARSKPESEDQVHTSPALLKQHLELRQLQSTNSELVILKDELDRIKLSSTIPTSVDPGRVNSHFTSSTALDTTEEPNAHAELVSRSIRTLELAVIQARQRAKHQKAALEEATSRAAESDPTTPEQRLRAISTTRAQLTAWLEESLEKCQAETAEQAALPLASPSGSVDDMERAVDAQYEGYLAARTRLLRAVATLKESPADTVADVATVSRNAGVTADEAPKQDLPSAHTHLVNSIEKQLLPALQHHETTKIHQTFADEQTATHAAELARTLERLSDESQLLQAFPILADSGDFRRAASVFGRKTQDHGAEDELARAIRGWVFAAEAADTAASGTMEAQQAQAGEAMETISRGLAELRLLRGTG